MAFPTEVFLPEGEQFRVRTSTQGPLYLPGTRGLAPNGDVYRYAQMGAVAGVVGKLYQAPVPVTNHVLQTVAAAVVGATTIAMTIGNTAIVANDYINGNVVIDLASNTGFGFTYLIDAHPAVAGSGVFTIPLAGSPLRTVQADGLVVAGNDSVQVAIATTANSVSLIPNNWKKVILSPASAATAEIAGVSVSAVAINGWGWLKTRGNCMVLTDGTVIIGQSVAASQAVAGAIAALSTTIATTVTQVPVGRVVRVATTTNYSSMFAQID